MFRQLTGDALLLYGIDVRNVCKLGEMSDRLQVITAQKYKDAAAERVKSCISQHNKNMKETTDTFVCHVLSSVSSVVLLVHVALPTRKNLNKQR